MDVEYVEFRICIESNEDIRCYWKERPRGLASKVQWSALDRRAISLLSRQVEKKKAERPEFELLGIFLFQVLLHGEAEDAFRDQFQQVRGERDRKRLRVVLHFE